MTFFLRLDVWLPGVLIAAIVFVAAYSTYFAPSGPWYVALYPNHTHNAFMESSHYAEAIISNPYQSNVATVLINDQQKADMLRRSGAMLLDPKGIALCSK